MYLKAYNIHKLLAISVGVEPRIFFGTESTARHRTHYGSLAKPKVRISETTCLYICLSRRSPMKKNKAFRCVCDCV